MAGDYTTVVAAGIGRNSKVHFTRTSMQLWCSQKNRSYSSVWGHATSNRGIWNKPNGLAMGLATAKHQNHLPFEKRCCQVAFTG